MNFSDWLTEYLLGLSSNVDTVFVEYIHGLLQDTSMDKAEKLECISEFLSSVTSPEEATTGSSEIFEHFLASAGSEVSEVSVLLSGTPATTTAGGHNSEQAGVEGEGLFDSLESQMRSLLQQTPPKKKTATACVGRAAPGEADVEAPKQRDACTIAVLRAAGVLEYQDNEESKSALQVALADAEFFAKQPLSSVAGSSIGPPVSRKGAEQSEGLAASPDTEVIQLEEVEDAAGYGKKGDIKPGNVLDALATLSPHQFASSQSPAITVADLKAGRIKRLPTPGDISSSTPAYLIMSRSYRTASPATTAPSVATSGATTAPLHNGSSEGLTSTGSGAGKKKKPAPPTKHLADIGARAEEKQLRMAARKNEKLCNVPAAGRQRLDDMDAFFISDDDEDEHSRVGGRNDCATFDAGGKLPQPTKSKATPTAAASTDILYEGGGNRERVIEAEKATRAKAAQEHAEGRNREKAERAKQLEAQATRKQAAQQKAQKQERRRR
uniref:Coiled-coil domain-containing protein 43 n=2 Tax=Schistocephalus solidus TaxID=70667 RepID=A0A0X3PM76_SCHSO